MPKTDTPKDLRIRTEAGRTTLSVQAGNHGGPRAVINVEYTDLNSACGIYLTPKQARRLADWLNVYAEKHNA